MNNLIKNHLEAIRIHTLMGIRKKLDAEQERAFMQLLRDSPEGKKHKSLIDAYLAKPEVRETLAKRPDNSKFMSALKAALVKPEVVAARSNAMKFANTRPEVKALMSRRMKEAISG